MVMKKAAWNGLALNVNDIIVLHVATRFSGVHNVAEPVKNQYPMSWTDPCKLTLISEKCTNGSVYNSIGY